MESHEVRASGHEYLALATELLQRARLVDAEPLSRALNAASAAGHWFRC